MDKIQFEKDRQWIIYQYRLMFRCRSSSVAWMPSFRCISEWVESGWICCRSTMIWLVPSLRWWSIFEYHVWNHILNDECCAEMRWDECDEWVFGVVVASTISALSIYKAQVLDSFGSKGLARGCWSWRLRCALVNDDGEEGRETVKASTWMRPLLLLFFVSLPLNHDEEDKNTVAITAE